MEPLEIVPDTAPLVIVMDGTEAVEVIESKVTVNIGINFTFVPFYFTATQGQTDFVLDSAPITNGVLLLAINGIAQSQAKGDFSVDVATITLEPGVDAGDIVAGVYAQAL